MLKIREWKIIETTVGIPKEILEHARYSVGEYWMSYARISTDGIVEIYFDDKHETCDRWELNPITKTWIHVHGPNL